VKPSVARSRVVSPSIAIAAAALAIYAVAMLWPYLAATLVRGSTITAWTHLATAPIEGRAPPVLPLVGATVGPDGVIMTIANDRLDPTPVLTAEAALADSRLRTAAALEYMDSVQELDRQRRDLMKRHAARYRTDLEAEIAVREARVALLVARLASANAIAVRTGTVSDSGYRSRDYHDEAKIRVAEAEAELAAERMALERARRQRSAADEGLFVGADGSSPNWAYGDWQESKTEVKNARLRLDQARSTEAAALRALDAARAAFGLKQKAPVLAPPGSTIRSVIIGKGATVGVGDPVARWIDCSDLFVDAPVSDAALPLIALGSKAETILEGEGTWREAHVVGLRGAAETIGTADIAAVAKGRGQGDAQVLLKLDADPAQFTSCPVGHAAYVHFPGAGLLAVLLARLGLR
jgi:multidrug resistance efflux pump